MSTSTQYNPNAELNARLLEAGASKTVYALVRPEIEYIKEQVLGSHLYDGPTKQRRAYLEQFRDAWTGKQDAYHEDFFTLWHEWSKPLVSLDREQFPFYYPTAGASEAIRHLIYDFATHGGQAIHIFEGEYEGYKAIAEAAGLKVVEHPRDGPQGWHTPFGGRLNRIASVFTGRELFFISQPSAIDGNVWMDFNEFIGKMPDRSVVVDLTYVGAVPDKGYKFDMNQPAVRNIVFSLSKPFGAYYDRIGGVFARREDLGLFGNKWFKNLTSLAIGTALLRKFSVFEVAGLSANIQIEACAAIGQKLKLIQELVPSDVFILATTPAIYSAFHQPLTDYLMRAGKLRLCLTPFMAERLGTSGEIQ